MLLDFEGTGFDDEMKEAIKETVSDVNGFNGVIGTINNAVDEYARAMRINNSKLIAMNKFATTLAVVFYAEHVHVRDEMLKDFFTKFIEYIENYVKSFVHDELYDSVWSMTNIVFSSKGDSIPVNWYNYMV